MKNRVYLSYRRDNSAMRERIRDRLRTRFDEVFFVDTLYPPVMMGAIRCLTRRIMSPRTLTLFSRSSGEPGS